MTIDVPGQFSLLDGEALKEAGMALTTANNMTWHDNAFLIVVQHCPPGPFLAEIFRDFPGIGRPKTYHAWGPLTGALLKAHIIKPWIQGGGYTKAKSRRNHAHKYQQYVRV